MNLNTAESKLLVNACIMILTLWSLKNIILSKNKKFIRRTYFNESFPKLEDLIFKIKKVNLHISKSGILIICIALFFILFNYITDKKSDNIQENLAIKNDSLKNIIIGKSNTITKNQELQESEFISHFKEQLDTLKNVNKDLLTIKTITKNLNDTLKKAVSIQKQTNQAATQLFLTQEKDDSIKTKTHKIRLMNDYSEISRTFDIVFWRVGNNLGLDSTYRSQTMNQAVTKTLELLSSESDNSVLLNDSIIRVRWQTLNNKLIKIHWQLNGYESPPYIETFSSLESAVVEFLSTLGLFLAEDSKYLWETQENKRKYQ